MITAGYLAMPLRTPAEVLATSMAAAQARLQIGGRVVRMDGTTGTLKDIQADGYDVVVEVVTDDNKLVREMAGWWFGRASL